MILYNINHVIASPKCPAVVSSASLLLHEALPTHTVIE